MAEGWLRTLAGDNFDAYSAGTVATQVHPLAIRAMAEVGIDISTHTSKSLAAYLDQPWDVAITVCDQARDAWYSPAPASGCTGPFPTPRESKTRMRNG